VKRIIVMRHAKSSWKQANLSDHERPLNGRGRKDTPRMGKLLVERGWVPDRVFCSDAQRTLETWAYLSDAMQDNATMSLEPQLYLAGMGDFRSTLSRCHEDFRTVLLLGHNPGWEDIVSHYAGERITMPTAAMALFQIEAKVPWSLVCELRRWRLADFVIPREL